MSQGHSLWIPILGLLGDLLTLTGGLILASDAWQQEEHSRKMKEWMSTFRSHELAKLKVEDIEQVFMHRAVQKAWRGTGILVLGFLLLVVHRGLDLAERLITH